MRKKITLILCLLSGFSESEVKVENLLSKATKELKGKIEDLKPEIFYKYKLGVEDTLIDNEDLDDLKKLISKTKNPSFLNVLEDAYLTALFMKMDYKGVISEAKRFLENSYNKNDSIYLPLILYKYAEALYYQRQFEEALTYYTEIEKNFPNSVVSPYASLGKGWTFIHQGRQEDAREMFRKLVKAENLPPAIAISLLYGMGVSYFNSEKYDSAFRWFIITLDKEIYRTIPLARELESKNLYYSGLSLANLRRYKEAALDYLQRLIDEFPHSPKVPFASYLGGWFLYQIEEYEKAIEFFIKTKDYVADSATILEIDINIAQSYYNLGRLREAIGVYKRIKESGEKGIAEKGLEICYVGLLTRGILPLPQADSLLREFLSEVPHSKDLHPLILKFSENCYEEGNYNLSLEWIVKLLSLSPETTVAREAKILRLSNLFELKKWEELARIGDEYFKEYQIPPPELLYYTGSAHSVLGDKTNDLEEYRKALKIFEKFLELYPENKFAETVRKLKKIVEAKLR